LRRTFLTAAIAVTIGFGAAGVAEAAPPTGVTAAAFHGRVELAWQPAPGATGYRVYRGLGENTVSSPVSGELPASATSFTDASVGTGTEVFYAVRAIVGGSESANSRVASATPPARSCTSTSVVVAENCLEGVAQWRVQNPSGIEGFATAQSVNRGESVALKVKASGDYNVEILRTGYYGGLGARQLGMIRNVPANPQSQCAIDDSATGLLDCANWTADQTVTTTASWPSGVYMINLVPRAAPVNTNSVLLVVRDDERHSDLLYGVPDTTYQAYNDWGGRSLYGFNSVPDPQATKVSYNRPYAQADPGTNQPNWYMQSDRASVYWLERSGYDVAYTAVSDLEDHGARVRDHRAFVSGAHDEYWSDAMRQALEDARDAKTHLFFTGANAVFHKVRFEGANGRVLVDYKPLETGLIDPSGPTGTWRDPFGANRPENALLGAMYIGDNFPSYYPLHVSADEGRSRVWRHTGLDVQLPGTSTTVGSGLVGWEWDARVANGQEPPGVETVASSPVEGNILQPNGHDYVPGTATAQMTRYVAPSGAVVVNTATNHWNRGLVPDGDLFSDGEADVRIRQATMNILADMRAAPATPEPDLVYDPPPPDPDPPVPDPAPPAGGATPGNGPATVPPGGGAGPPARASMVRGTVHARWRRTGRTTRLVRLWATNVDKGATVDIRCAQRRCGVERVTVRFGRAGTVELTRVIPRRNLRPGSVLGVRLLAGGKIGKVARFTTSAKRLPRRANLCLSLDARRPGGC
jgi:hypothetical protein